MASGPQKNTPIRFASLFFRATLIAPLTVNTAESTESTESTKSTTARPHSSGSSVPPDAESISGHMQVGSPPVKLPSRLVDFFLVLSPAPLEECPQAIGKPTSISFEMTTTSLFPASQPDMPVPEQAHAFLCAKPMHLVTERKNPYFFSTVLMQGNGTKLYVGVLHFHELIDREDLIHLLGGDDKARCAVGLKTWMDVCVYCPRIIAVDAPLTVGKVHLVLSA